ncbi:hypothetical protein [Conexibacter sp. SYSU D00693]|uniref:hypothetical protein n=1 Tax=Conexibacter sp. SYSU D00693 TaxID=2812560 RepID=UPI00196B6447|nr:hypothetical protein [Conexibacter sp. SYSU D00693]
MAAMDLSVLWRAALIQTVAVALLSLALVAVTPDDFFEDHGWFAGPLAWAVCALVTARLLRLPPVQVLVGAALAGVPSLVAIPLGAHWAGAALGILVFALWCARLRADRDLAAHAV